VPSYGTPLQRTNTKKPSTRVACSPKPSNTHNRKMLASSDKNLGLFETLKVTNSKPVFFQEHWDRFAHSCSTLGLHCPLSYSELEAQCTQNLPTEGFLKYTLLNNKLTIETGPPRYTPADFKRGFRLTFSNTPRPTTDRLYKFKTTCYDFTERHKAQQAGFDDCIFLTPEGYITETSIANIFFRIGKTLYTPSLDCPILPGIIRAKIIEREENVVEGLFKREILLDADEIFLTNSLMGAMEVREVKSVI